MSSGGAAEQAATEDSEPSRENTLLGQFEVARLRNEDCS